MAKEIDGGKLEKLYRTAIKDKPNMKAEKKLVFRKKIHFDKRQYSIKLPKRLFDFFEYKEGDSIIFVIDDTVASNPKLNIELERAK
jgi:hypothetical protein